MGSLLEGYRKQRDQKNFARNQEFRISGQLSAVDYQVQRILAGDCCSRGDLARSAYLHHYLIGVLDSITSFYERETRKRLGLDLYRGIFVTYLQVRFLVPRGEGEALFAAASENVSHKTNLIEDGYADGLDAMNGGRCAKRLLNHFSRLSVANEDLPGKLHELAVVAG
jgi:hypothetical protein